MKNKPQYIVVAGINGAGKSTLFTIYPDLFAHTQRINADEILRDFKGDWHNNSDNLKAMRIELHRLHEAIKQRRSIHFETTLAGSGKAQANLIEEAHHQGFEVTLLYVTLDSSEKAIQRVNARVANGGHGVEPDLIKKRYVQSLQNLTKIASKADTVSIFDNSENGDGLNLIYSRNGHRVEINLLKEFPWIEIGVPVSHNRSISSKLKHHER